MKMTQHRITNYSKITLSKLVSLLLSALTFVSYYQFAVKIIIKNSFIYNYFLSAWHLTENILSKILKCLPCKIIWPLWLLTPSSGKSSN